MKGPQITKKIGIIQQDNRIYIEDYVYSFLEQRGKAEKDELIVLYGHVKIEEHERIIMIYGAAPLEELTDEEKAVFQDYEQVGTVDMEQWCKNTGKTSGIILNGLNRIDGYYVFCEANESMKEYMNHYYRKQLRIQTMSRTEQQPIVAQEKSKKAEEREEFQDELIPAEGDGFFDLIRAVVILIFIFLCAIAVGTINSYDKMQDFTEAAAGVKAYEESDE